MTPELAVLLSRSPVEVAQALIGWSLISSAGLDQKLTGGIICETEAYLPSSDPAAHNRRGKTMANRSLFERAGTLYVHQMRQHLLIDIVTQDANLPGSVLIRALVPTIGVDLMRARRGVTDPRVISNGPGKLTAALAITKSFNGKNLEDPDCLLKLLPPTVDTTKLEIKTSSRIGVTIDFSEPLRFFVAWEQLQIEQI
jgi:DNA-3-methyladenine glycosylase